MTARNEDKADTITRDTAAKETPGERTDRTRRAFLGLLGGATTVSLAGCLGGNSTVRHGWNEVDSGTQKALYDVSMTTDGPLAIGEGGRIIARRETDWKPVTENGPAGASNGLVAAAVTADRRAVWFCGSSGAIGRYAVAGGNVTDYTAPGGKTSSWVDVAVTGPAGRERVHLLNGSGELLPARASGGSVSWGDVTKPAGGLSAEAVAYAGGTGYLCDGNGDVYRIRGGSNGGDWQRVGIDGEGATLRDLVALDDDAVDLVTENGAIYVYNSFNWLSLSASENALHAIDRAGEQGLAAGVGGTVVALTEGQWKEQETPIEETLHGVAAGSADHSAVAVGANGTILERFA